MAKVLAVCPYRAEPVYQRAFESFLGQSFDGIVDHLLLDPYPFGDDGDANLRRAWMQSEALCLNSYDALYCQCDDVIAPEGALQTLWDMGYPITYGLICHRHRAHHMSVYLSTIEGFEPWEQDTLDRQPELARRYWGQELTCKGKGLSCALIQRHVFDEVILSPHDGHQADHWMATVANKIGILQKVHLGVLCGHMRPDGSTVWPDIDQPGLYRIER